MCVYFLVQTSYDGCKKDSLSYKQGCLFPVFLGKCLSEIKYYLTWNGTEVRVGNN